MRFPPSLFAVTLLLPACASELWDKRVYSCEDVTKIEVDRSAIDVTVDPSDDDDDCYVEVKNLSNHSVDDGVLSGVGLFVFTNQAIELDVSDTLVEFTGPLTIQGPRGDYRWLPDTQRLDATDIADNGDDPLFIDGPIETIVLDNAGYVQLSPGTGFDRLEGNARELDLTTNQVFGRIDVQIDEDIFLEVLRNEVYRLDLSADGDVDVDLAIRSVEVDPSSTIVATAGGDIDITPRPGGSYEWPPTFRGVGAYCQSDRVELLLESDVQGAVAYFDAVNSDEWPNPRRYESHRLELVPREPNDGLQPGNVGYRKTAYFNTPYTTPSGTGTGFSCAPGTDFNEDPIGSQMTYLLRIYDDQGRMLVCFGLGDDPEGMTSREFANGNLYDPDSVTSNACDWSKWNAPAATQ